MSEVRWGAPQRPRFVPRPQIKIRLQESTSLSHTVDAEILAGPSDQLFPVVGKKQTPREVPTPRIVGALEAPITQPLSHSVDAVILLDPNTQFFPFRAPKQKQPPITTKLSRVVVASLPVIDVLAYRGRNDDGDEATATWIAAQTTDWSQLPDTNFRVRFEYANIGTSAVSGTLQLQYSLNGGAFTNVTGASSVVRAVASPNVADGTATTNQLTFAGQPFDAGEFDEVNGIANLVSSGALGAQEQSEAEFSLQIIGTDVIPGDTIKLRITTGAALIFFGLQPTITVSSPASATTQFFPYKGEPQYFPPRPVSRVIGPQSLPQTYAAWHAVDAVIVPTPLRPFEGITRLPYIPPRPRFYAPLAVTATLSLSHTVDAVVTTTLSRTHTVDALVFTTTSPSYTVDAVVSEAQTVLGYLPVRGKIQTPRTVGRAHPVYPTVQFEVPFLDQAGYRARNDDGNETTATWIVPENTPWTQVVETNFRIRFVVDETGGHNPPIDVYELQYNRNGAGWNLVTAGSNVARSPGSSAFVANNTLTTRQLTSGSGAFTQGIVDTNNGATLDIDIDTDGITEVEFLVFILGADTAPGDVVQFRVVRAHTGNPDPALLATYTQVAQLTVVDPQYLPIQGEAQRPRVERKPAIVTPPFPISGTATLSHTVDAVIQVTATRSHTVDAVITGVQPQFLPLQAEPKSTSLPRSLGSRAFLPPIAVSQIRSHTVDAVIQVTATRSHTVDALIYTTGTLTHTVDAVIWAPTLYPYRGIFQPPRKVARPAVSVPLPSTRTASHTVDAVVLKTFSLTHTVDAVITGVQPQFLPLQAQPYKPTQRPRYLGTRIVTPPFPINVAGQLTHTVDAVVQATLSRSHTVDAVIVEAPAQFLPIRGAKQVQGYTRSLGTRVTYVPATTIIAQRTHTVDAVVLKTFTPAHTVDAVITGVMPQFQPMQAEPKQTQIPSYRRSRISYLPPVTTNLRTHAVTAVIQLTSSPAYAVTAVILKTTARTYQVDVEIGQPYKTRTFQVDAVIFNPFPQWLQDDGTQWPQAGTNEPQWPGGSGDGWPNDDGPQWPQGTFSGGW